MASIPRANAPISNSDGSPTREWYNYLRANLSPSGLTTVEGEITVIAEKLGSPDGTVQNIPPISAGGTIVAQQSIAAVGAFPGAVILSLVNDQASPGNTYFYGTSPTGSKGWVSLTTALDQASIGDLGDVDTTTTAPTDGQVLTWVNADSKWEPKTPTGGGGGGDQFAVASGTDTITATFPTTPTLADGLQFKVRAAGANTTTAPTFSPNGIGALTLYKLGGVALAAGDIFGAGHELIIRYRASPARYEIVNPAETLPAGGATGQALIKNSGADGDASWATITGVPVCTTLNPSDKAANVNLFQGNRVAVGGSVNAGFVRSKNAITGKRYFEAVLTAFNVAGSAVIAVGIATSTASLSASLGYSNPDGWAAWGASVGARHNGSTAVSATFAPGDVISVYVDQVGGKMWIAKNGVQLQGDPSTGVSPLWTGISGTLYAAACPWDVNTSIRMRFDPNEWYYNAPPGYGPIFG